MFVRGRGEEKKGGFEKVGLLARCVGGKWNVVLRSKPQPREREPVLINNTKEGEIPEPVPEGC